MITACRNFSVEEITAACGGVIPPAEFHDNLNATLAWLDDARDVLGVPVTLTNLWRSDGKTAQLAAEGYSVAKNSEHKRGLGADVVPGGGVSPYDAASTWLAAMDAGRLARVHQIIVYPAPDNHVHIGLAGETWRDDMQLLLSTSPGEYAAITRGKLETMGAAIADALQAAPEAAAPISAALAGILLFFFVVAIRRRVKS